MNERQIVKHRYFSFKTDLSETDASYIKKKLGQLAGVIEASIKESKLRVSYDLRQTSYLAIKKYLKEITKLKDVNVFTQGIFRLICYCEQNELDHANHKTNWQYYIQNLYLSLHKEIIE